MLYLMQHGEAFAKAENPNRPLTDIGRRHVQQMASRAKLVKVQEVIHSGKLRAQETAEIMAEALGVPCSSRDDLEPNSPVEGLAEWLTGQPPILLVGHLPHLSRLLSHLLMGDQETELVNFRNAGLICMGEGQLQWILWPEMTEI